MAYGVKLIGISEVPGVTLANNTGTPLVAADIGKPVTINSHTGQDAILCSDGDHIIGILGGIELDANFVTVLDGGYHEVNCSVDGDAPDPDGATPYVIANATGGVKKHTAASTAVVLSMNVTTGKAIIKIL